MIKAVVNVKKGLLGLSAELHADIEKELLLQDSNHSNEWGINQYPAMDGDNFIEVDSLINIRPHQGNRSRDVQDSAVRKQIFDLTNDLIR